jgi:hypothetical protein
MGNRPGQAGWPERLAGRPTPDLMISIFTGQHADGFRGTHASGCKVLAVVGMCQTH